MSSFKYIALSIISVFATLLVAKGQQQDSTLAEADGWIEKMNDKVAFDVSLNNAYEIFEVITPTNKLSIYPNARTHMGFKLNYDFISMGFQLTPDFIPGNNDEDDKGRTKSFGLGTSFVIKHWNIDISFSKVKGYYLNNTDDFVTRLPNEPYIQFPDLHYTEFSIRSGYSSNNKFSLLSLTSQTERQLKSVGSFMPALDLSYYIVDDRSMGSSTQKSRNIEMSIGPGYSYTFVANKKFYLSLGLMTGIGYLNSKITTRMTMEDLTTIQDNFIFRWDGKIGIGYNGNNFYSGLYSNLSGIQYKQENTTAKNFKARIFYHIFVGIRFNAPEFLKRKVKEIKSKYL